VFQNINTDSHVERVVGFELQKISVIKPDLPTVYLLFKIALVIAQVIFLHIYGVYLYVPKPIQDKPVVLPKPAPGVKKLPMAIPVQRGSGLFNNPTNVPASEKKEVQQEVKESPENPGIFYNG
jgi:hypothetical protein